MLYMLIVPELVIMWAARQYIGARQIAMRNKGASPLLGYAKNLRPKLNMSCAFSSRVDKDSCLFFHNGWILSIY